VFTGRAVGFAILGLAGAAAAFAALLGGVGLPEWVFLAVLLSCAFTVLWLVLDAGRQALTERRHARSLAATAVVDVARRAVVEERVRLSADIEAVVRASVTTMGEHARDAANHWDGDPAPALHGVQDEGRRAATELRRMLGLLRDAERAGTDPPRPGATRPRARTDIVLGLAAAVLSVVERFAVTPDIPASMQTTASLVLTALAAATLALRRRAPALGTALCGAAFFVGAFSGHPLSPGSWMLLGPAWLAWAAMARRTWPGAGATALLIGGIAVNLGWYNPVNLPICLVILGAAAAGGALVGWSNQRRASAHDQVVRRSAELEAAAGIAVHGERTTIARDLHDVVSHAVAVMVMQAGAAEALRSTDPQRARAALTVVRQTAVDTLGELDRLVAAIGAGTMGAAIPATGAVEHDADDLRALVHRMNGAGLRISLALDVPIGGAAGAVVYRIAQEALTNAARHAPGARVTLTVHARAGGISVDVIDDGPGSDGASRRGYGLVGIAERVERIGGQLITGPPLHGTGFRVSAHLPTTGSVTA
jgi:signal transduction histidine kinase